MKTDENALPEIMGPVTDFFVYLYIRTINAVGSIILNNVFLYKLSDAYRLYNV